MQDKYPNEVFVTILAVIGLFTCITLVLVYFILHFQKKRYQHKEELISLEEKNKRELVQSKLEVVEQTRVYIARELHDNIGTLSSLMKINLNLIASEQNEAKRGELISDSIDISKTLIAEVKQLSLSLNTDRLTKMSFCKAIELELDRIRKLNLFMIEYNCYGDEWSIPPDRQIIIYRVCQELLHNILKHANAFKVTVSILFEDNRLQISIADDGVGFSVGGVSAATGGIDGSGLVNMNSRVELIGGKLDLESIPGKGTKCYIDVPFTNA